MNVSLFEEVADAVRAMAPDELGELRMKTHRRGIKVWFGPEKPTREHYEGQLLARRHVDGIEGMAIEVGFHAEHRDEAENQAAIDRLIGAEAQWRPEVGPEAEVATFFGADGWRRISEAWIEPDIEDPELAFEIAGRLVDYVSAIEPLRAHS